MHTHKNDFWLLNLGFKGTVDTNPNPYNSPHPNPNPNSDPEPKHNPDPNPEQPLSHRSAIPLCFTSLLAFVLLPPLPTAYMLEPLCVCNPYPCVQPTPPLP